MAIFGEFVPPSPGSQGQSLQSGPSGEVSRWGVIANVKTVALSGANYSSVKAACDAVTAIGPTAASPWHIKVSPGVYMEDPFTVPPYTIVEGAGRKNTVIKRNDNFNHFVTLSTGSELRKCSVFGPTAVSKAAIRKTIADGLWSFVNSVVVRSGYYGILCDPGAGVGYLSVEQCEYEDDSSSVEHFTFSTNEGVIVCTSVNIADQANGLLNGFVCVGANAEMTLLGCRYDCQNSTGDAIWVDDSGKIRGTGLLLENGTNAIHVGANGNPFLAIHGSMIRGAGAAGFVKDIFVESATATMHYTGSLTRSRIDNAVGCTDFIVSATNIDVGDDEGFTMLGGAHLGPDITHVTPLLPYGQATWLTGLVTGGGVYRGGGLVVNVDAGTGFINDGLHAHQASWNAGHVDLAGNSEEYIYVDINNTIQHSVVQPDYASVIMLGQAKTNAADVLILTQDEISIVHPHSRLQEYLEDVVGPINVSGGATTANAHALKLDVDGGEFMVGLSERSWVAATEVTWVYWYRDGGGLTWTAITAQDHVDDSQWNNAGALAALGGGAWKKDLLFVVVNHGGVEYHVVYGQETFASKAAAEAGAYPVAPEILSHYGMRSGGIVVEGATGHIDSITDARPRIGQAVLTTGAAAVHAALAGLAADDHAQYLNTTRADLWLAGKAPEALVTNGDTHAHTGGAGAQIDHTTLANKGANTHAVIDAHLIDTANPHAVTAAQVGSPPNARTITAGAGLTGGGDLSANRTLDVVANADGSIVVNANDVQVGVLATDAQHGARGGGTQHAVAVASGAAGFMSGADKAKLDADVFGNGYTQVADDARTTLTGANSTSYPPVGAGTKLSMVTAALPAGTYRLSWSAVADYSATNRAISIRIYNVTDGTTLWEVTWTPQAAASRRPQAGHTLITFAGVAKTIAMQFRNTNTGDTSGMAYARMDLFRVS